MSVIGRKNFELAFINACRKNDVKAAFFVMDNDDPANPTNVRIYVGGETLTAEILKKIVAAGEHAVGHARSMSSAEARIALLFDSLSVAPDNVIRQDWNALKQELARLRGSLENVVRIEGEPMERWPLFWAVQDEQGGCVHCGCCPTLMDPLKRLEQHEPQCGFRRAYEALVGK